MKNCLSKYTGDLAKGGFIVATRKKTTGIRHLDQKRQKRIFTAQKPKGFARYEKREVLRRT